jgi:mono/diheme cytochrome c family protein
MQSSKRYPGPGNTPAGFLLFVLSALSAAALVGACGDGNSSPTPPDGSSQVPIEQASPGLPRGQAVFARYCNSCHPDGAKGAGPSLIELGPGLSDDLIRDSVRKGRNRMPAYPPSLIGEDALADMIAYIRTLK